MKNLKVFLLVCVLLTQASIVSAQDRPAEEQTLQTLTQEEINSIDFQIHLLFKKFNLATEVIAQSRLSHSNESIFKSNFYSWSYILTYLPEFVPWIRLITFTTGAHIHRNTAWVSGFIYRTIRNSFGMQYWIHQNYVIDKVPELSGMVAFHYGIKPTIPGDISNIIYHTPKTVFDDFRYNPGDSYDSLEDYILQVWKRVIRDDKTIIVELRALWLYKNFFNLPSEHDIHAILNKLMSIPPKHLEATLPEVRNYFKYTVRTLAEAAHMEVTPYFLMPSEEIIVKNTLTAKLKTVLHTVAVFAIGLGSATVNMGGLSYLGIPFQRVVPEPQAMDVISGMGSYSSDNTCVICLENLGKSLAHLACGHTFDEACIRSWLAVKPSCPLCRE